MAPCRRTLLLALSPALAAALRHRAGPELEPEEDDADAGVEYQGLDPRNWTAQQVQEEIATNFTKSELFQTKLKRWCKWDPDGYQFCHLKNTITHYCPTLYKAAPEVVNRTVLVQSILNFLKTTPTKDIWSRDGLASAKEIKGMLQPGAALLQVEAGGHPRQRNKHKKEAKHEEEAEAALDEDDHVERKHAHTTAAEQRVQDHITLAENAAKSTESLDNPFPEVTSTAEYVDHVQEHCSVKSKKRMPECVKEAKYNLLCWSMSKALLEHVDIPTISSKMQEMLKTLPELNFRL